jgi:hypothetical protein
MPLWLRLRPLEGRLNTIFLFARRLNSRSQALALKADPSSYDEQQAAFQAAAQAYGSVDVVVRPFIVSIDWAFSNIPCRWLGVFLSTET